MTSSLDTVRGPAAVALGNFDGVHRGHQQVIQPVVTWCHKRCHQDASACHATVVTFSPHPQDFFTGQSRPLLTPPAEKVTKLESLGVDQLVLLPFNQQLAALSPQEFVETILIECLQAQTISVGRDFRFGRQRSGTAIDLQAIAATHGVEVIIVPLESSDGDRISSSAIRQALLDGQLDRANYLLGRSYCLTGEVVQGKQLGRTLGFPTANLKLPADKFLPRRGVYSVQVTGINEVPLPGVMNIGCRPTVDGIDQTVEVHLLNWSGDLYQRTLVVSLEKFLRTEERFPSLEALKAQIQADCDETRAVLGV